MPLTSRRPWPFAASAAALLAVLALPSAGWGITVDGPASPTAAPASAAGPMNASDPGAAWSDALWNAARTGNRDEVDRLLGSAPAVLSGESADRFRAAVARLREHRD